MAERRTKLLGALDELERTSKAEAERRVEEATQEAERRLSRATEQSERKVANARDLTEELRVLRGRILGQLDAVREQLDDVPTLLAAINREGELLDREISLDEPRTTVLGTARDKQGGDKQGADKQSATRRVRTTRARRSRHPPKPTRRRTRPRRCRRPTRPRPCRRPTGRCGSRRAMPPVPHPARTRLRSRTPAGRARSPRRARRTPRHRIAHPRSVPVCRVAPPPWPARSATDGCRPSGLTFESVEAP